MADRTMSRREAVTPQMTDWKDVSVTVEHGMPHGSDGAPARAILRPLGSHGPGRAVPTETAP